MPSQLRPVFRALKIMEWQLKNVRISRQPELVNDFETNSY
jgi:hypothetical protein